MGKNIKPIFSYNADVSKNAYMNWRICEHNVAENLVVLESGFEDAAKQMMESILADNSLKQADVLAFPIMYAIDHSIELYLKAIIYNLEQLETGVANNYKTHDIQILFSTMLSLIKKQELKTKGLQAYVAPLKEYLDELYAHIADSKGKMRMDFARYPFDTDRNPHFYVCAMENVVVDMENLLNRYSEITDCLEGLCCMYDTKLEAKSKMQDSQYSVGNRLSCDLRLDTQEES